MSNFFSDFVDWLADVFATPDGLDRPTVEPEEPSMDGVKGKVVRLDVAVTAVCLLATRIYVKDLTQIIEKDMESFFGNAGRLAITQLVLKKAFKAIATYLGNAIEVFRRSYNATLMGRKIVSEWRKVDADLRANTLFTHHTAHRRKIVSSRRPPKQKRK